MAALNPPTTQTPLLILLFQDKRYPIQQDEFVIGRGCSSEDLVIADPTISRGHATVYRVGQNYYIRDNDSTHGISYRDHKINERQIEEGDTFYLGRCPLRFTFQETHD